MKFGRELDRLGNVGWLQEPLLPEDALGYRQLCEAIDTPVCYGAFLANRFHFRDVFESGSVDIINPDICYCGGLSECKKITVLADAYGVPWSPHVSMVSPISMAASLHLAVATPNFVIMENADQSQAPLGNILLKEPLQYFPGYAVVPERPGLGVEFDENQLAKVTVQ
jgi:L-alanine-DL-glutamate epimerase-like enolase superfamily enzyme